MRLYEFDGSSDPLTVKITALSNQLKAEIDKGDEPSEWTTDQLLSYLQQYGINLDITDLYDMIKNPPLNNIISNIQGDQVIFKGHEPEGNADEDEDQKVVKQMAKNALK
jgi:hypothetical protein